MTIKRMTATEDAAFARLWGYGASMGELMETFGLRKGSSVTSVRMRLGLPPRKSGPKAKDSDVVTAPAAMDKVKVPVLPPHPFWTAERDLAVLATGGIYQKVAVVAEMLGKPHSVVLQRWHRLRAA